MSKPSRRSGGTAFVRRALLFLDAVRARTYPNARWLAEVEEISIPTARRVINRLRDDYAAPLVYSDADRGWELTHADWSFPATVLADRRELIAFALALNMGHLSTDPELDEVLETIWLRLSERLQLPEHGLDRLLEGFSTDRTDRAILRDPVLLDLINAIARQRIVSFTYASPWHDDQALPRVVSPLHLRHVDGATYLLADTDHGERVYNASFLSNLEVTRNTFQLADHHQDRCWADSFGVWLGDHTTEVTIQIGPPAARYFAGQIWHPAQRDLWEADVLVRCFPAQADSPELTRRLLSLGPCLLAVDPREALDCVRAAASTLLDNLLIATAR